MSRRQTARGRKGQATRKAADRGHKRGRQGRLGIESLEPRVVLAVPAGIGNFMVTEINYNPHDPSAEELVVDSTFLSDDFEFVELQNIGTDTILLDNVKFVEVQAGSPPTSQGISFNFTGSGVTQLAPGQYVVIARNQTAFQTRYPGINIAGVYSGDLDNGGETVTLRAASDSAIFSFKYNDSGKWPSRPDGDGATLELKTPTLVPAANPFRTDFLEDGDNWRGSSRLGGTPGRAGDSPINNIVINEILSHTDEPQVDSIELYNPTSTPIDVGGWFLTDSTRNFQKFQIPAGTTIGGLGYLTFVEGQWVDGEVVPTDPMHLGFGLDAAYGDDVWLMKPETDKATFFVDQARFGPTLNGESLGRWPNASSGFYPMKSLTLGAANSGPRVGPVIVSEIQYRSSDTAPDNDDYEFVELFNPTTKSIDLSHYTLDGDIFFDFPDGTTIGAGATLVVVPFPTSNTTKLQQFRTRYPSMPPGAMIVGGYGDPSDAKDTYLSNKNAKVQLVGHDQPPLEDENWYPPVLDDEVDYKDDWYELTDGGGRTLHRLSVTAWGNDETSWGDALPSPGTVQPLPPFAGDDTAKVKINTSETLDIYKNDIAFNGTSLNRPTVVIVSGSGPAHAKKFLVDPQTGAVTYTPVDNYTGPDSFRYRVKDTQGRISNEATVSITVKAPNRKPVANDDRWSMAPNTELQVYVRGVLYNDTDLDSDDRLTTTVVIGPEHGTLHMDNVGMFRYKPTTGWTGTDTFTYRASDGEDSDDAVVTIIVGVVNQAPLAVNDNYEVNEDTTLTIAAAGVLANDTDADQNPLAAAIVATPSHGTVSLNPNGSFTYEPDDNYHGPDSFTYKANDGQADSNVATVSLTVRPINDPPVALDDVDYTVKEDEVLAVAAPGVLGNDSDLDGDLLSAVKVSGPAHGTLALNTNGSFVYTPAPNYHGTDSFTYMANDGSADSTPVIVSINVDSVNDAPVAANDSGLAYTTNEDTPLTIAAPGVLNNDTDAENDPLSAILVTDPPHGNLTLAPDGSFIYTPQAGFTGQDVFTYKANDGTANSNVATVVITVNAVNHAPVAANDSGLPYTTNEDTPLSIAAPGVLGNDTDIDGDSLTAVLETGPIHGTLTLNGDGSFTYTPATDYHGPDSFTYKANDGQADSNPATVSLTIEPINDAPTPSDDTYTVNEDGTLTVLAPDGVLKNDTDLDGDALTATFVSGPSHGTLTLHADGSFVYTPNPNYHGTDSFTYKANDATVDSNVATVNITVSPVNDAPQSGGDRDYAAGEGTTLTVAAPGVLTGAADIDGDSLTAELVSGSGPSHGTLTLNSDGSFTYTPESGYFGLDSFTYRVSDGTLTSDIATVSIAINNIPTATADSYSVHEDKILSVDAATGVLANDSDANGDSLTAVLVSGSGPSHGTLVLHADGSFVYTPIPNFYGADSFTYKANDGLLDSEPTTVTITVDPVLDPPTAAPDAYRVAMDGVLTVDAASGVLANDTDGDGDSLMALQLTGPSHGTLTWEVDGSFVYTPEAGYFGIDTFTYLAIDATLTSDEVTVTITVDRPPVAGGDSGYTVAEDVTLVVNAATGVLQNDSDPEGGTLTAVIAQAPSHGTLTLNADGSFTYVPAANFNGTDSFTYRASDGFLLSDAATVTIAVTPVNDAPLAQNDSYTTPMNTQLVVPARGLLANDSDPDGDTCTPILVTAPKRGSMVLRPNGSLVYTPRAGFVGTDSFTYRVNDGNLRSTVATVTITVGADGNHAPVVVNDAYGVGQDQTLDIPSRGVLANDSDADSDTFTAVLVASPTHGTLTLRPDGSFTYKPAAGYVGGDSFTYKANDGKSDSAVAAVAITVGAAAHDLEDLGAVDFLRLTNQSPQNGELWYLLTASHHAMLTVELGDDLSFTPPGSAANLTLFAYSNGNVLEQLAADPRRIDYGQAVAGRQYALRVSNLQAPANLVLANLVNRSPNGADVTVSGTAGNDRFEVLPGSPWILKINDLDYELPGALSVEIAGGGGADSILVHGTAGDSLVTMRPGSGSMTEQAYDVQWSAIATATVYAGGGNDELQLYDSAGNDTFVATPTYAGLFGPGYDNRAFGFPSVYANASTGSDVAKLYDSTGNDTFVATPTFGGLLGTGFFNRVRDFDAVHAFATAGGNDVAKLYDSAADDQFYADPQQAALYRQGVFYNRAKFFETVHAYSTAGGHDVANLYGSADDDTFYADPQQAALYQAGKFYNRAKFFAEVYAHGAGGNDKADLYDSPSADALEAQNNWARLKTVALDRLFQVEDFSHVKAKATTGGDTKSIPNPASLEFQLDLEGPWT